MAIQSDATARQMREVISECHEPDPCKGEAPPDHPSRLDQIARRAHQIYPARGGDDGRNLDDWLQAEREIDET